MTLEAKLENEGKRFNEKPGRTTAKWLGSFLVLILALTLVGNAFGVANIYWEAAKARITASPRVEKKVYEPENIINQVYYFTTTCEDVGRDYANWKNNEADYQRELQLANTARTQGEATQANNAAQQLSTAVSGALQQVQQDAAAYNARSINYTANPFKTHGLPYRITVPLNPIELNHWTPPSCG